MFSDRFKLPQAAQTLLASQWQDFLLPPNQLSFYALGHFCLQHIKKALIIQHTIFESVINGLVKAIVDNGGEVILNTEVVNFMVSGKTVTGVEAMDLITHQTSKFTADTVHLQYRSQESLPK